MITSLTIPALRDAYRQGILTPTQLVEEIYTRHQAYPDHAIWITPPDQDALLRYAHDLEQRDMSDLPLYGIPFAIKDNIDLAQTLTTCACPDYAYTADQSAFVVARLIAAGAIPIGKTNLDQFATGLNGTRSPYGVCRNAYDPDYIAGGSSSGSAVAVALGLCSFALGTDTAGSGRVPAAFNHIVGLKPTCGLLSTRGMVPACRSLDALSIFALTAGDAQAVLAASIAVDHDDPYSRPALPYGFDFGRSTSFRLGVPRQQDLEFFGDVEAVRLFQSGLTQMRQLGAEIIEIDFTPFLAVARLLYEGPWVAERYQAIRGFLSDHPEALISPVSDIILSGEIPLAADAFAGLYQLQALRHTCNAVWSRVDCVMTPSTGTIYRIDEVLNDPIRLNSNLGRYTNFMNLLDYAAVALPAGFRSDGLPLGITLFAPAHQDTPLLHLADRWLQMQDTPCGRYETNKAQPISDMADMTSPVQSGQIRVAVVGAHLQGQPLNPQLTTLGGRLIMATQTAAQYRLYALADGKRPALVRVAHDGAMIACEVWEMPLTQFGRFVAGIPTPLGIGSVVLQDGSTVCGFICEGIGIADARDITAFGGWLAYRASL